jgi:hypothetical protein
MRPLSTILSEAAEDEATAAKATQSDWAWSPASEPDADGRVFVPQGAFLGETLIALDDGYEGSDDDCAHIARNADPTRVLTRTRDLRDMAALLDRMVDDLRETLSYAPEWAREKWELGRTLAEYEAINPRSLDDALVSAYSAIGGCYDDRASLLADIHAAIAAPTDKAATEALTRLDWGEPEKYAVGLRKAAATYAALKGA